MKVRALGTSSLGLPQIGYEFGSDGPRVLILGGVHGDEYEGVVAAEGLLESFLRDFPYRLRVLLVPRFNPDGVLNKTRGNGHGVDLNRNLPTKDWSPDVKTPRYHPGPSAASEPENQFLVRFIEDEKPAFVLSLHSYHPVIQVNGDCGPEAAVLAKHTGYRIDDSIGYPTPGCLGTYAALERPSPTITYEIQRGQPIPEILRMHVPAILDALHAAEKRSS